MENPNEVIITKIDIKFWSLVDFFAKALMALTLVVLVIWGSFAGIIFIIWSKFNW